MDFLPLLSRFRTSFHYLPGMGLIQRLFSDASIEKKAHTAAAKYADKQQRYRAETIARTELAKAYNGGNDKAVRKMIADCLIPMQVKIWSTAADGHVCEACEALEGEVVGMDSEFSIEIGKNVKRTLHDYLPSLHPRCKCAIVYEDAEKHGVYDVASQHENVIIETENPFGISTEGRRNEAPLSEDQIQEAKNAARKQGYDGEIIYSEFSNAAFHGSVEGDPFHYLVIGTDAFPVSDPGNSANEQVSLNGCMAHEIVGHYEAGVKGTSQKDSLLEEVQASIRTSKFGIELMEIEREILFLDTLERLSNAGLELSDVENQLDIWER